MEALGTLLGGFGAVVMLAVVLMAGLIFGWRRVLFSYPLGLAVELTGYLVCALLLAGALWWLTGFDMATDLAGYVIGGLLLTGALWWLMA
ncbi:hypothetical protein JYK14_07305 [Siccirubricoccus sp. KC 17139]|uniref:YnfA family protein n=1 Tax=Siccirubricoccus soli TaxID=2899147 RepID=A0ABT1D250_9PROT|nr:hypothetical protein [Siccirubricoccus soli]MCO6415981.1 hypothetical protein [Siccirubricoccus soli]MCP2682113.1 hypothetical protein [Siccirubricoccus soli]